MITNHTYMYVEGPPLLYIYYLSPEQTKQDRCQETSEVAGYKGQSIKTVTKANESKQWEEDFRAATKTLIKRYTIQKFHFNVAVRGKEVNYKRKLKSVLIKLFLNVLYRVT